jgi:hypothetical protein
VAFIEKYRKIKQEGSKKQAVAGIFGSYIGARRRGLTHDEAVVDVLERKHIIDNNNKEEVLNNYKALGIYDSIYKIAHFLAGYGQLLNENRCNEKTLSELLSLIHKNYEIEGEKIEEAFLKAILK